MSKKTTAEYLRIAKTPEDGIANADEAGLEPSDLNEMTKTEIIDLLKNLGLNPLVAPGRAGKVRKALDEDFGVETKVEETSAPGHMT